MAHLKRGPSGHLLRCASGHLAAECCDKKETSIDCTVLCGTALSVTAVVSGLCESSANKAYTLVPFYWYPFPSCCYYCSEEIGEATDPCEDPLSIQIYLNPSPNDYWRINVNLDHACPYWMAFPEEWGGGGMWICSYYTRTNWETMDARLRCDGKADHPIGTASVPWVGDGEPALGSISVTIL